MPRHLRSLMDLTPEEMRAILDQTGRLKMERRRGVPHRLLEGKSIALIFHKPSLRTKVSFEIAMTQLGGGSVFLTNQEIGLGSRESPADVARVLSGYVEGIVIRTFGQDHLDEIARWSRVPVINALTDRYHPCQILGDLFTIQETRGSLDGVKVAFLGDGNNVCNSWLNAATRIPMDLRLGIGAGYDPPAEILEGARKAGVSEIGVFRDAREAVKGADIIYTDVWASMGQESDAERRKRDLLAFQVNGELLAAAGEKALVMHCLPAHRGEEITDEIMDGDRAVVFDQAENRLHAQKALLVMLLGGAS